MSDISIVQAVVIGIVEGLTEFIPVSSTAHMDLVPQLIGWDDPGAAFSAVIQLGPILAIVWYFRKDILKYLQGMLRNPNPLRIKKNDVDARMGWYAIGATFPILIAGKLLEKTIEGKLRGLTFVAVALIAFSVVIWLAEQMGKRTKSMEQMSAGEAFLIGIAQCVALIPGVSRSGATMTAALFQNFDRESATRFSFLLSIPALSAAGLYKLVKDVLPSPNLKEMIGPYLVGTVVAGISAYIVVHWFLGYVKNHKMNLFIAYRIILGVVLLILIGTQKIKSVPEKETVEPLKQTTSTHKVIAHR